MINIDLGRILINLENLGSKNPAQIMWYLFIHGGWVVFVILFLWIAHEMWLSYIRDKYDAKREYVLLSISIPKMNEQSPKAVEHIFSHLAGAHGSVNIYDKYVDGKTQDAFSLEIISTEGYIQFIIRTITKFRDLVEAAVFAQYPDAEIAEVPDYTENFPDKFPNEEYDLWGTEFILTAKDCFPIRSYQEFEHPLTGEFKDPMAALLENYSHIGKGEHVWFQIIVTPIGQKEWKEAGDKEVKKLIGAETKAKKTVLDKISDSPIKIIEAAGNLASLEPSAVAPQKDDRQKERSQMQYLSPGEKDIITGIENKLSKIGFQCKMRGIYVAKKEVFSKTRAAHPLIGAIKQFNTVHMNSLKPEYKKIGTGGLILFKKPRLNIRKSKLMRAYKARSNWMGMGEGFILNIEELATVFHFPDLSVKAPLLKKTEAKKGEAPFSLPVAPAKESVSPESGGTREGLPAEESEDLIIE